MGTIVFLCAILACLLIVFFIVGIIMLHDDCSCCKAEIQKVDEESLKQKVKKAYAKEIKYDFIWLGICLISFVIFLPGYLIPTRYYKNAIKPSIKAEYGNVYEYEYSAMFNDGSFLYNNEKYSIKIIKDIDNNKYIKITKADDNNDSDESLNLPLKNK